MKFKCMLSKKQLAMKIHIQIECVSCKRITDVWSSNVVGMNFSCQKCGSLGFHRKAVVDEKGEISDN